MKRTADSTRAHRKREGAAALEFALVLPLLVILLFGIIDFGYLMFVVSTMNNAAREGARRGAVESTTANVVSASNLAAQRYLNAAGLGTGCRINCPSSSAVFTAPVGTTTPGNVTVTVTLPQARGISGFTYRVLPGATNPFTRMGAIRAVSQMRWELSP
ncbi:MAG TPA: TadE/TadG family type IV pilus assembly protein [Polyangiales bacterium]|nr:TadE/TadG family type IV pilus assembly protein [Polyangiales bacterium]